MHKRITLAYATNKGLLMMNEQDAQRLTHVNLAFGILEEGRLSLRPLPDIARVEVIRRWNPALKFVLSIGGWGAGGYSTMAMTAAGREDFAQAVKAALDEHNLDGVDMDWEYPCDGSAGIDYDPRDRENFTLLLTALREAVGEKIVSIAAGAGEYYIRGTEMEKVAAICDYVQIMTYDMRNGMTYEAGHHTSLYASAGDVNNVGTDAMVNLFASAGVPLDRIVIGAAFYSRHWEQVPNVNQGLLQAAGTVGMFGPGYAQLASEYIGKNGWTRYWDDHAKAAYLFNGSGLYSYDDPDSLRLKCAYVRERGLAGIMYWEHSCDESRALLSAIDEVE